MNVLHNKQLNYPLQNYFNHRLWKEDKTEIRLPAGDGHFLTESPVVVRDSIVCSVGINVSVFTISNVAISSRFTNFESNSNAITSEIPSFTALWHPTIHFLFKFSEEICYQIG